MVVVEVILNNDCTVFVQIQDMYKPIVYMSLIVPCTWFLLLALLNAFHLLLISCFVSIAHSDIVWTALVYIFHEKKEYAYKNKR